MGVTAEALLAQVVEVLGDQVRDQHHRCDEATIVIAREGALSVLQTLRDDPRFRFDLLADLTAVDYLGRDPRFEIVMHLCSLANNLRLRVKIGVPESEPWVHSLVPLWKAANWLEREVWDMFGIRFLGHPDLRRILLYEEFVGHPLRKDYPVNKRQPLTAERDPIATDWKFNA